MGKSKKKNKQASSSGKPGVTDASVSKVVEDIWRMLQDSPGDQLPVLWAEYDRLQVLISTLRRLRGPCQEKPARSSVLPVFEKWAQENGALYKKNVEVIETPGSGGFGLRTNRDIQKEEVVLLIPEKIMMSSVTARQGELGVVVRSDYMLQTMPNVTLALHLLHESSLSSSFWKPYIDFLPIKFSLPLFFSKSELMLLQGSPSLVKSLLQIRNITKLFAHLFKLVKATPEGTLTSLKSNFHYDDFLWAVACVMSRQNEIPSAPGQPSPTLALIPVWDLCNHSSGNITTFFSVQTHTCDCYAMADFKQQEEFTIFYGPRTNSELLMQQGFTYPSNQFDNLQLKLGLSPKEEEKTKKLRGQLLDKLNLPISGAYLLSHMAPLVTPSLAAFIRVFTAPLEQLQQLLSLDTPVATDTLTGSWTSSDMKALQFLDVRCCLLLKTYSSNVQEDERLLAEDQTLSDNARQIILLRKSEKIILSNACEYIQLVKDELEGLSRHPCSNSEAASLDNS